MIWTYFRKIFRRQRDRSLSIAKDRISSRFDSRVLVRYMDMSSFDYRRGNLSIGGFGFDADRKLLPGTQVELLFLLPDTDTWINATGSVLGSEKTRAGLGVRGEFSEISFENERLLARWLDLRASVQKAA